MSKIRLLPGAPSDARQRDDTLARRAFGRPAADGKTQTSCRFVSHWNPSTPVTKSLDTGLL